MSSDWNCRICNRRVTLEETENHPPAIPEGMTAYCLNDLEGNFYGVVHASCLRGQEEQ